VDLRLKFSLVALPSLFEPISRDHIACFEDRNDGMVRAEIRWAVVMVISATFLMTGRRRPVSGPA
jgi:hypothetical protein